MTAVTTKPTAMVVIADSAFAYDERGEILETVDWNDDGSPDWTGGGIVDPRGAGQEGFDFLTAALNAAEFCAKGIGYEIVRVHS